MFARQRGRRVQAGRDPREIIIRPVVSEKSYAAYDALPCSKQRCLIHLIRDVNQLLVNHPFDAELKTVTGAFGHLLRGIVSTIDQRGLKRRHLGTHRRAVGAFLGSLSGQPFRSEAAEDLRQRLLRSRDERFTFL